MCFTMFDNNRKLFLNVRGKSKVATEDIKVFKVVKGNKGKYLSTYRNFEYEKGKTYKAVFRFSEDGTEIYDGLHSYNCGKLYADFVERVTVVKNRRTNFTERVLWNGNAKTIMECIVPKGSTYYENETGEIVSDTLRVNGFSDFS